MEFNRIKLQQSIIIVFFQVFNSIDIMLEKFRTTRETKRDSIKKKFHTKPSSLFFFFFHVLPFNYFRRPTHFATASIPPMPRSLFVHGG